MPRYNIMHDLFEGVCHYSLCQAIDYFVNHAKFLNFDKLNSRKKNFEYGNKEIQNLSGAIERNHINKKKLKMSAREMLTFVQYFPLMVGDLIPLNDPVWCFILNLIEIIDILLRFKFNYSAIELLAQKIEVLNTDYIKLFNDSLKPKFHNLVHYPAVIRQIGPLRNLWCFKFEAKHRDFKIYCRCVTTRKIICLTLGRKYELRFAYQIMKKPEKCIINDHHQTMSQYHKMICEKLPPVLIPHVKYYSKIKYQGFDYSHDDYVSVLEEEIIIYVIREIVLIQQEKLFFLVQKLIRVEYQSHVLSYKVDPSLLGNFALISINNIVDPATTLIKTASGETMIFPKEYFEVFNRGNFSVNK